MVRVAGFLSILGAFSAIFALQFIPRKGTETENTRCKNQNQRIAIYPRKGTETVLERLGGRRVYIAIYPRKGTETICLPVLIRHGPPLQFIPRKGTETVAPSITSCHSQIAIYTP